MKNLVRTQKITNGRGSIKYITKDSDGEILASYSTQTTQEWDLLFDFNQEQFKAQKEKGGWIPSRKTAKGIPTQCVEARMYVVALPNEMASYPCKYNGQVITNDMELAKAIANDWRNTYGTDCYVAIHWNKSHTNFHAHILVSERKKKESTEIKRAKRNRYYNAEGKECKKAEAVRVVHKGDIISGQSELYESRKLDFYKTSTLDRIKEHYSKALGTEMFKEDGLHLPQTHLPRINERTSDDVLEAYERKKEYNELVKEHNQIVDTLKENHHNEILENAIRPMVVDLKRQKRYRKRYLEESLTQIKETFKIALMPLKTLLRAFGTHKTELDTVRYRFNSIDNNIQSAKTNIDLQQAVLHTQVKPFDFRQKRYINGLINDYKNQISSLEAQKDDLSERKQKLEVKVLTLKNELECRSRGITRRIEHYKYTYGEYPSSLNDIIKLEKEEQNKAKVEQQQSRQIKPTTTRQQPTVTHTAFAKSLKNQKQQKHTRIKSKNDLEK